jgi:hypothetical protein
LAIRISGTHAGSIGKIDVTENLILRGKLTITFAEGMVLNSGDSIEIMSYGSQTGVFSAIDFVNPGEQWWKRRSESQE